MHQVRTGDLEYLCYPIPDYVSAVFSCIADTEGKEILRDNKPFLGFYIDEASPINYYQFDEAVSFIKKYIDYGEVLVICQEGRSRSVAIALAYYISTDIGYEESIKALGYFPTCLIHIWSLLNWAYARNFIDKSTFDKEMKPLYIEKGAIKRE